MSFTPVFAAKELGIHLNKADRGGLEKILKKKYFRVLTTRNPYDYYIYQGNAKGIQYEMIKEFTKYLNKKYVKKGELRIVFEMIPVDFDQLIPMLKFPTFPYATIRSNALMKEFCRGLSGLGQKQTKSLSSAS